MGADLPLRLRAARHEVRCWECRVTWRSWVQRIFGIKAGFSPKVPKQRYDFKKMYR